MATNTILNVLCWATQYVLCEFMKGLKPDPTKIFKFQLFRGYLHGFSYATGPHIYSGRLLLGQEYCIFTWSCYGPHVPCDWCPHFKRGGSFGHIYIYHLFQQHMAIHSLDCANCLLCGELWCNFSLFFCLFQVSLFVYSFSLGGSKFVLASNLCVMVLESLA